MPGESYPVGKVDTMYLYPMTFEEFLWAKGEEMLAESIMSCNWDVMSDLDTKIQEYLRQYYYVGGMPEENLRSKSLSQFVTIDHADKNLKGLRCSMKPYIDQDWMENIPLYSILGYFKKQ